jgi:hypothetical protein
LENDRDRANDENKKLEEMCRFKDAEIELLQAGRKELEKKNQDLSRSNN